MKRKFSLLLAIALLVSCFVGLTAVADGETAAYQPEIAYTNVAYGEGLVLMFAVNAPATLAEGETVELLFWKSAEQAEGFSKNDQYVKAIQPEADKVTIGGASYYVFKCNELDASMMTDTVYARPLYTNKDGKRTYGEIVDYSVVEYVKTACGEFAGFAGLAADVQALLNSLLGFGSAAQEFVGTEVYAPNGYLADDQLHKIWVTPVVNGTAKAKVFAGFFKYEADSYITVTTPFYDGKSPVSCKDAAGNKLEVAASANSYAMLAVDSDIELVAEYKNTIMQSADPAAYGAKYYYSTYDKGGNGNSFDHNIGGLSMALNGGTSAFPYQALGVVEDPYNPGQWTYIVSTSGSGTVTLGNATSDWSTSMDPYKRGGFADTIEEVISIEIVLGRNGDGSFNQTAPICLRGKAGTSARLHIGYFTEDGTFRLCNVDTPNSATDPTRAWNKEGAYIELPTKVATTGYTRFVFTVDFANEVIKAYASDPVTGELVYQAETKNPGMTKNIAPTADAPKAWKDMDPQRIEWIQSASFNIAEMEAELSAKDINGDGIADPLKNEDGIVNQAAVKYWNDYYNSVLIKYYATYLGDITK